jgi:hypothetical protein
MSCNAVTWSGLRSIGVNVVDNAVSIRFDTVEQAVEARGLIAEFLLRKAIDPDRLEPLIRSAVDRLLITGHIDEAEAVTTLVEIIGNMKVEISDNHDQIRSLQAKVTPRHEPTTTRVREG